MTDINQNGAIQIQRQSNGIALGDWETVRGSVWTKPQYLTIEMRAVQRQWPGCRVRTIDQTTGQLIDLLF